MKSSRQQFIRTSAALGAGLGLALRLPASAQADFAPNVWVRIAPDETVTVMIGKSEMGQGVIHGLPTILADELDADPRRVRTQFAPPDAAYADPELGEQATGGSTSVQSSWLPLRRAGATARAMLVAAAAQRWNVEAAECTTRAGVVYHAASGRSAGYGSLAPAAALLPVPSAVALKPMKSFVLIGKPRPRPDIPAKVTGRAEYGIDVRLPGMVYAAIARSPVFGGRVRSFDDRKARAVAGVIDVVRISNGIAVIAKNTWAAFGGRNALTITWDEGANAKLGSAQLFAEALHLGRTRSGEHVALMRGEPERVRGTVLEATYQGPFLAHATLEPMNTTAYVHDGTCEVWSPTQVQQRALSAASAGSGVAPDRCTIHTTLLGGGFGRRLEADYVGEAAEVARAVRVPVKVVWSREDDIQHDFYRPMSVDVVRGVVAKRELAALSHVIVQPSWLQRWKPAWVKNGVDPLALEGIADAPYAIANLRISYVDHQHGIPIGSWRAPQANWNTFVTESFIDELAHAAGADPVAFRLGLLRKNARAAAVLRLAAERARWGRTQKNVGQGVAVVFWAGSLAAMVAEVSLDAHVPKVHRVVVAVDCGTVVNPDIVVQQAQGATNFGLSAALTGKITIARGRVEQNNFYDYTVLRMADAPAIEVPRRAEYGSPKRRRRVVHAADRSGRGECTLRAHRQTRSDAAVQRRSGVTRMLSINVNGISHEVDVSPDTPLLWVLRDELGLTGTKFGCGVAQCGACTIHLGGNATRSCIVPVSAAAGKHVQTIEGLSRDGTHPVQRAWIAEQVPQCGYCQSGQIMAAVALLREAPRPSDTQIDQAMTNICRCGTYDRIRRAIHRAARETGG